MSRRVPLQLLIALPFGLSIGAFFLAGHGHVGTALGLDYEADAAGSIRALAHGHLGSALAQQPLMGFFSLLLRAPFVALAPAGNLDAEYLLGLLPCLAIVVAVLVALRRAVGVRWPGGRSRELLPWLFLASAPCLEAILFGHPEEMLGAALCVGAGLAAMQRRPVLCGVLLGLAVATKQWGVFAVIPVLAAGTGSRPRTAVVAIAVGLAMTLPLVLGNSAQFSSVSQAASQAPSRMTPITLWAAGSPGRDTTSTAALGGFGVRLQAPGYATGLSRPLMAAAIAGATLLAFRRRRRPEDVFALLALVFLARCAFDPVDNVYYHAPFLLCLVAWEALRSERLPLLSLVSAGVLGGLALVSRVDPAGVVLPAAVYALWAAGLSFAVLRGLVGSRRGIAGPAAVSAQPAS